MPIIESPADLARLQDVLRAAAGNFELRFYDATPEDYEQITDEDIKCEYVDGELIVHSPASLSHEDLASFVNALLRNFVSSRQLGRVYGSNAVMVLGERRFSPDVSVLRSEHADRRQGPRVIGPMDLVVEVLSSSTRKYDRETKLPAYREGRVGEIWLIDPQPRQFEAHVLEQGSYASVELSTGRWGSPVLPGLVLEVDWFWQDPLPDVLQCGKAG